MHLLLLISLIAILLLNFFVAESIIIVVNREMTKMVEFPENNRSCKTYYDRKFIRKTVKTYEPTYVQKVNSRVLNDLSNSCTESSRVNKGGFIFPGTKWCGPGNIATRYNDLGTYVQEDRCCRDHDHCPNQLEAGQCRNGICNISPFTSSHCDCDAAFRKCLLNVKSDVANVIGSIFFNVAQRACFRERRFCPQGMRENLSYTWFCAEWKFTPFDNYIPAHVESNSQERNMNKMANGSRQKSDELSKINMNLEQIFGNDEDIAKIMNDPNV